MRIICTRLVDHLSKLNDLPLLFIRIALSYGFYGPARMKLKDTASIAGWFSEMDIPFPTLNAYLATYTELFGFILLILGFWTRFISVPLLFTMIVAIKTVHWSNGFEAGDNGFEIPLYYVIMLLTLLIYGPGKLSLDHLLKKIKLAKQQGVL